MTNRALPVQAMNTIFHRVLLLVMMIKLKIIWLKNLIQKLVKNYWIWLFNLRRLGVRLTAPVH